MRTRKETKPEKIERFCKSARKCVEKLIGITELERTLYLLMCEAIIKNCNSFYSSHYNKYNTIRVRFNNTKYGINMIIRIKNINIFVKIRNHKIDSVIIKDENLNILDKYIIDNSRICYETNDYYTLREYITIAVSDTIDIINANIYAVSCCKDASVILEDSFNIGRMNGLIHSRKIYSAERKPAIRKKCLYAIMNKITSVSDLKICTMRIRLYANEQLWSRESDKESMLKNADTLYNVFYDCFILQLAGLSTVVSFKKDRYGKPVVACKTCITVSDTNHNKINYFVDVIIDNGKVINIYISSSNPNNQDTFHISNPDGISSAKSIIYDMIVTKLMYYSFKLKE